MTDQIGFTGPRTGITFAQHAAIRDFLAAAPGQSPKLHTHRIRGATLSAPAVVWWV